MTKAATSPRTMRCAVYCRKSTEHGLDQEFNSLDAQREAGEAFIKMQAQEGWSCVPDRYEDGGFTGGNTDRPALQRLLADIDAGEVDCVVVQRVDRLSRSLLDFAKLLEQFEKRNVAFASVTQQFNTDSSMGRLVMNVLMSFAEFERQMISERTRDKIAAARRKGKWSGGPPVLGYDIDPKTRKLVVKPEEAERVRQLFHLYIEHQALLPVVREVDRRGWVNKRWVTKAGVERGGRRFDKATLSLLLKNVLFAGKVKYKREIHAGEHEAIVESQVWQQVQDLLQRNGRSGGAQTRNRHGALLKGLLRCRCCGWAMSHTFSKKDGRVAYRYYACLTAQKRGYDACPSKSVPAEEIETFVVEQIKAIGRDAALVKATIQEARKQVTESICQLRTEKSSLERELKRTHVELRKLATCTADDGVIARVAELNQRVRAGEQRLLAIRNGMVVLEDQQIDEREATRALAEFEPVWNALTSREQARIIQLLVREVSYDGGAGKIAISFHPNGLKALNDGAAQKAAA